MKIFLIGFMGSGKSTIGRSLASLLHYEHIDLDRLIESTVGATIGSIFEHQGEVKFREYEAQCLQRCGQMDNVVVSTGGGAPCFGDNMAFMCGCGLTIYLQHEVPQLAARLAVSKTDRPLLRGKDREQIEDYIRSVLPSRELYYNRASLIVANPTRDARRLYELIQYELTRKI